MNMKRIITIAMVLVLCLANFSFGAVNYEKLEEGGLANLLAISARHNGSFESSFELKKYDNKHEAHTIRFNADYTIFYNQRNGTLLSGQLNGCSFKGFLGEGTQDGGLTRITTLDKSGEIFSFNGRTVTVEFKLTVGVKYYKTVNGDLIGEKEYPYTITKIFEVYPE